MKYVESEVIEKATTLFWQKGFQAAGMRDIQQALDIVLYLNLLIF